MKIGFYAGSFDPFTNGHLNVVRKSANFFDLVIVGIGVNSEKSRRTDMTKMKKAIEKVLKKEKIENAKVVIYEGLTTDVALENNSNFLIRGIRDNTDYGYEEVIASINEEISGLDTIYIRAGELGFISSSMVIELVKNKKDVSKYVPKEVLEVL